MPMPPVMHHQLHPDGGNMVQMVPNQTNNNISMVMVMSNLMTKRKNRKKQRTSASVYTKKLQAPTKYQNPDFYF
jgi:hypothetical protein